MCVKKMLNWFDDRLPIISFVQNHLMYYKAPKNLSYMWNFGSLAGIALVIQILTGIFLAMHYIPGLESGFDSVQHIMRNVNGGWLLRYIHAVGASFFFMVVYVHMARGLYYGSHKPPREVLWGLGVIIFLVMMATAFLGYALPGGQMSLWGAQVITGLFSAIPFVGEDIMVWLRGGFTVSDATISRFFSLHYLLPFIIVGIVVLHVWALHHKKSNNPTGLDAKKPEELIPFHPYYTVKDSFGFAVYLLPFCFMIFFLPDYLGHSDNYIVANPLQTPPHIVPEWYFLPFYAILRAVPDKLMGVLAMFGSIAILFALPALDRHPVRSGRYRPLFKQFYWIFIINFIILGVVGAHAPDAFVTLWGLGEIEGFTWTHLGRIATLYYFGFFLAVLPFLSKVEKPLPLPKSIGEAK